jgi:ferritin
MLSKIMLDKLNKQINFEFYSSNIYLQMASWADTQGLEGCAAFLKKQAREEMEHMHKIFEYVLESGEMAVIGKLDAPATDYDSVEEIFKKSLDHEKQVTKRIHDISETAWKEKDLASFNFMQWFVNEQHEEEASFTRIVDKIKLIGVDKRTMYLIDRELGGMAAARK